MFSSRDLDNFSPVANLVPFYSHTHFDFRKSAACIAMQDSTIEPAFGSSAVVDVDGVVLHLSSIAQQTEEGEGNHSSQPDPNLDPSTPSTETLPSASAPLSSSSDSTSSLIDQNTSSQDSPTVLSRSPTPGLLSPTLGSSPSVARSPLLQSKSSYLHHYAQTGNYTRITANSG
jgi:hypothetical protein